MNREQIAESLGLTEDRLTPGWKRVIFVLANKLIGAQLFRRHSEQAMEYAARNLSAIAPEATAAKFFELYAKEMRAYAETVRAAKGTNTLIRRAEEVVNDAASEVVSQAAPPPPPSVH